MSVVGFCMGGALSFASVSKHSGFKIGGIFYGIPDLNIFRLDQIKSKVIAHFGREDPLKGFSDAASAELLAKDAQSNHYPIDVRYTSFSNLEFTKEPIMHFVIKTQNTLIKSLVINLSELPNSSLHHHESYFQFQVS